MNGCRRRGERVRRSPLWSIRGREYTGGADATDLAFVGARRRRRYEPRNSIPPFGASPVRTLKGDNRNQQVTKKENLDEGPEPPMWFWSYARCEPPGPPAMMGLVTGHRRTVYKCAA